MKKLTDLVICVKGAGDLATGVVIRLFNSGFRKIVLLETSEPLAVRRTVTFSEAVYDKVKTVEGITSRLVDNFNEIEFIFKNNEIPVVIDPKWTVLDFIKPDVVIDAILAKKNMGTNLNEAPLVVGLGPGFYAGKDVHCVVETNRGHFLGTLIYEGKAADNTGVPGIVMGFGIERVIWSPADGKFKSEYKIGDAVKKDEVIAEVSGVPVKSKLDGVIRGLLRNNINIKKGVKVADVDPRGDASYCRFVSEKSRAIGGAVLEAILKKYNK
jgi:xanthine dehydrogenase accessory factor